MTSDRYVLHELDLGGDRLAVGEWRGDGVPILCIHGVSSTHRLWSWTAAQLPDRRLVAPDLRGRGGSIAVGGPFGLSVHADDMRRVLDAMNIDRAVVAGMSLGGFVATAMAAKVPDRIESLLLVDGGLPMRLPIPDLQPDQLSIVFASRIERTKAPYESAAAYAKFFRSTLGVLLDDDDPILDDYFTYDLDAERRVRLDPDALLEDSRDAFFGDIVELSLESLSVPTHLLAAEWSLGAGTPGAYDDEAIASWRKRIPAAFDATTVPGTDHASLPMTTSGAAAIADALRRT